LKADEYASYTMEDIAPNSIQKMKEMSEYPHVLLIDDAEISNEDELNNVIENFYTGEIFQENTKVHMKLKINLREYVIISNVFYPTILKVVSHHKS